MSEIRYLGTFYRAQLRVVVLSNHQDEVFEEGRGGVGGTALSKM